ncbi:LuxR family transcriptional regulator [Zavarzinia compransoris]|uniref:helix-turn-helix transcriptional regulator n=1 Tax=Zavarzinia marina TaxID=2911065 RepID=UPI001F316DBD|nr:LuxR family transcriptional regulator [Zavarzinia marina]MCF4166494.1 LuxR family transcriptional regulator [Zavarzinia marina]
MNRFLDMVDSIGAAETAESCFDVVTRFATDHGFVHGACMEVPRGTQMPDQALMMVRMPEAWVEHYIANDFALVDPVFRRAATELNPFTWANAARGVRPAGRRVMQEARAFGLHTGLTIPIHGPKGYRAEVTFAGGQVDDDPRLIHKLRYLGLGLHDRLLALSGRGLGEEVPKLTPREHECLHWVAAGKSDWAISQILSISETTVHWHVEGAKRKFSASTRMQLVVTAIRLGLIQP